jgi:RNA polymerase sigma-70 factor (ECF subfamily)
MRLGSLSLAAARAAPVVDDGGRELFAGCQAGDEGAWRRLIGERAAQVYRWAVLLGLGPADAEDAAQEVFAVAARRIRRCRAEQAFSSWLFQITRRVCANHRRQAWWRRWLRPGADEAAVPAFEPVVSPGGADELAVRGCLARMSSRLAEVLVLVEVEGFTRDEAAATLGVPPGTVASRLRLARQAFERLWTEDGGER